METIVIIGGGFAGLNLAKHLDKSKYRVKVIDRNNFHCFPPLFYQVASSGLDPSNISFPLRREFFKLKNTTYHMGHVKNIDLSSKQVTTSYETISYDKLVIAAGSTNNYFGMEELGQTTYGIKTVAQASYTRDEILDRLERGALCQDKERRRQLLSFLVVGGGPSGVEIAGALGEMKKDVLPREYPELDPEDMSIVLVEGQNKLLGPMSAKASARALEDLKNLMVEVRLGCQMKKYENKIVTFGDGHQEYWETLIWTAGVKGEPMPGLPPELIGHGNRILVDEYNRVQGYEDSLYAVGDIALMQTSDYPHGHPQMAQPALQQSKNLAHNLNLDNFDTPFHYNDKGSMATIGKHKAVVDLKKTFFSGWIAWMMWMFIHLISILGMRNRINVMLNWIWNYLTYSTSLRLLFRPAKYPLRKHWGD
ncbi:MAG: NAD(P)/FAD-dependent oxidoreductase [Prevotella sp.]|nr:NAD(P)/FAD-dependent oxidoreductase [Bacteroides sp.]MCM1366079.1 NAD(P)/FAD-dependent oxidoreductase [Prevotella sp.]MCM1436564.1 NAD(P)/FAD-dependent oxidoreductase [Prevotella sp.]